MNVWILRYLYSFLSCQVCFSSVSPAFCVIFIQGHAGSYFYYRTIGSIKEALNTF